jgi:dUTP pyrophosphatase
MELSIKKLHPSAKLPSYAHESDAGMDLYALEDTVVAAKKRVLIATGIAVAIPDGYVGLFWDKSGLANKHGLTVLGGVIDAGYRGELLVGLFNTSDTDYTFQAGDKVTQMLIQPVLQPTLVEVTELNDTLRGEGGFGSTGK